MTRNQSIGKRIASVCFALAILFAAIPLTALPLSAVSIHASRIADPSTMDDWLDFFPISDGVSTENAGGVWMDKSVFTDAAAFVGLGISQDDPNSFLVALSAMAANMSVTGMSHVPTDSILVLDVSGSMNDNQGNNDVAEELVQSANASIKALLETNSNNRVGVVLYSGPTTQGGSASANDAVTILPLARYTPSADGSYLEYTVSGGYQTTETVSVHNGVVIEGTTTKPRSVSKTVVGATYIQKGVSLAMEQFISDSNTTTVNGMQRKPVIVLMSDGAPTVGSTNFTSPSAIELGDGTSTSAALGFVSQLSAAYAKAKIEEKYGTEALFYTLGLGLSNSDTVALSVLDPDHSNGSTAVDDFWNDVQYSWNGRIIFEGYNHISVGETLSLGNNQTVTKIATPLEQNYVDRYFSATGSGGSLADALALAFRDIVSAIQLQSSYYPTLIAESEDLSGYVSFVDKIGQYMTVTDVKGVVIDNHLFSGADLASNFVASGGELGTFDNPTALGMEMVAAVRARLGLESNDVAVALIALAYEHGQLSYTDANNFSNYIGWYANAAGEYLGFYNEGTTQLPPITGDVATDPAFAIRSYGYLGAVDASHGVSESDMMYATVQVRKEIATGEELVTFAVPAALIPTVTYNVALDEDGNLSDLTVSGADNPIRLVYEVALDEAIHSFNIKELVSAEYLSDPHNVSADGAIHFYTNQWEHENTTGYGTVNTYSYFNPSRQNDKYYYLEDAPVYTDTNGTLYTGASQPSADGTFYRSYKVYKDNGSLRTETVYRALSAAAKATAVQKDDGTWYIPKGNVHVNLDGYTVHKSENLTETLSESNIPFVDAHNHSIDDAGYNFYVGATLGNNGKLTVTPETGIKLSKSMADGVADPGTAFAFDIFNESNADDGSVYPAWLVKADGTEAETNVSFSNGTAIVELNAGDILYVGGMPADETFRIVERETVEYVASSTGLSAAETVTVNRNEMIPISFVNDERGAGDLTIAKEVEHDFGAAYEIPPDKEFTIQVTLSGVGTANTGFKAAHSGDGAVTSVETDANGSFTVRLAHDEKLEIFGLPAGTVAVVTEPHPDDGFTPEYWDNGEIGDGVVTVGKNAVASVIVKNDYAAAEVYPVYVTVSGDKHLSGADWQQGYRFEFKLEKLLADGTWQQLGEIETASYGNTAFRFDDAFADERYTAPGSYYYRIVEIEPATPLGGFSYDKTVHSFAVHVGDADMDGRLEITDVVSDRPATTVVTETANGWNVNANFTNTYSTSGTATVTIDVTKGITNNGGEAKSPAGYIFGLFDIVTGEEVSRLITTERGFARFVLTYDAASAAPYRYILKEIAPDPVPAGWCYSTEEIAVTVEVMDNGDGTISAVIYAGDEKPADAGTSIAKTFTNVYDPADATLTVDFVGKQLNGRELNDREFTFEVQQQNGTAVLRGSNDAQGRVTFDGALTFDAVGTYFYNVVETSADGLGVTVDKTVYRILVTVTDDNGALQAGYSILNIVGDTITFVNEYEAAPVEHVIEGAKTLRGRTLVNDEFTFVLTELTVDGAAVPNPRSLTARNLSDGTIFFPAITYHKAGTYVYGVEEILPEGGKAYGITYDATEYKVTIVVRDDGKGALFIDSESVTLWDNTAADALRFVNAYEANPTWAQLGGNKTLTGKVNNALLGGEFEFVLYDSNANWEQGSERETVENGAGGVFTFTRIDFSTDADSHFLVKEVHAGQTIDGITYDDTVYRVWVEVTDDLKGQLHATVHIYDGEGIPQDAISFVNVYEVTGGADVTLSGEKVIDGREWKTDDRFTFELFKTDENGDVIGEAVKTAVVTAENHSYSITLNYTAQDVGKTFLYLLKENGANPVGGLTYSSAEYKIQVVVEDDDAGGVTTTVTVENATASTLHFVNVYGITTGTDLQFEATKALEGKELGDIKFSFDLIESNENWASVKVLETVENNGAAIAFTAIEYMAAGDYYYVIAEQEAGRTISGITYDDATYRIHVKVVDNLDGTLSRSVTITGADGTVADTIAFVNTYRVSGEDSIELSGVKTFEGRDWTANDVFVIEMYGADANFGNLTAAPVATAVVDRATGRFTILRTYGVEDLGETFYYVVKEQNAGQKTDGITYSDLSYRVTVTVEDNGDGTVNATATADGVANNALHFTNRYSADKTTVTFDGTKSLETKTGIRELKANDFTFDLYKANENFVIDGEALQSVKNDENGAFTFAAVDLAAEGTCYFVIKENSQNPIGGVVYDNTLYHVTVTVTDNGLGNLVVSDTHIAKVNGGFSEAADAIAFVNEYNAVVANVTVEGSKILSGRVLADGEFRFLLTPADEDFYAAADATAMVATNLGGTFTFDALSFTEVGTYYFIVSEDAAVDAERVSFDDTVYFVTIEVTDDENGKLVASDPVVVKKGSAEAVDAIAFTNVYVPKPADVTVDVAVDKTVVNKGSETIGPEGFEFLLRDAADGAEGFTAKSDEHGRAQFTLTFTEADVGKTFRYVLTEVDSGRANVTYSTAEYAITIEVALDEETNTLVATTTVNEAAAAEIAAIFENVYDYTPEYPDSPQTGYRTNVDVWMALAFVSGSAALTLSVYTKRKRRRNDA